MDTAFGEGQIKVGHTADNRLTFQPAGDYKPQITLKSGENDALEALGFNDGDTFRINPNASLKDMARRFANDPFDTGDVIRFSINGQEFSYDLSEGGADENKTLAGILSDINKN